MQVMKKLSWKYLNTIMLNAIFKNVNNLIFYIYLWVCFIFLTLIIYLWFLLGALIRNEHHLRKSCKHIKLVVLVHICISWCKSSKVSRILFAANSSCRKRGEYVEEILSRFSPFLFFLLLISKDRFDESSQHLKVTPWWELPLERTS